jgi:glycosyltransferase involved in cell wall biosynthesis
VSHYTGEKTRELFKLSKGPDAILYNPVVVPEDESTKERDPRLVVFTGTLTAKKGIVSLIRAWPEVLSRCKDAKLRILGRDGRADNGESMQSFLQRQLPQQSTASVEFAGFRPYNDVFDALNTARVAVFPSYAEAFACAPLEAMIRHCPTIYSQRGSGAELIADGDNGLLIDPDNFSAIAEAITRVLEDDALASRLATEGRRRAEAFAMPKIVVQNEQYFRSCIERFAETKTSTRRPRLSEAHT